jgi:hypothetical protein
VQKTARNVIAGTAARELVLMERLGCSEKARILAESAFAEVRKDVERLSHPATNRAAEVPGTVAEGSGFHQSGAGHSAQVCGM